MIPNIYTKNEIPQKIYICLTFSDQPSAALRGGAEHTRAGVVRARAFMLIFAAPALIPAPFIC